MVGGLIALWLATSLSGASELKFHEIERYKLGGEGGWDYLTADSTDHRLYIARSQKVLVVDTQTGQLIHTIENTDGVHGVALDHQHGQGFTSNGKAGTVTVFDLKTFKPKQNITVGLNPDCILYDDLSERVFTFNGKSQDVTAIDAKTLSVVGHLDLGGKPEFAVSDGRGHIFVNLEDASAMVKFDPQTLKKEAQYALASCESPTGLSIDRKSKRLFVGCEKLLAIVNADNGKVIKTLPVGQGVDATAFDPARGLIFASAGEGKLSVIKEKSANEFLPLPDVPTQKGARTMALDARSGKVYLATADFGTAPVGGGAHARPPILPDSFVILVLAADQ